MVWDLEKGRGLVWEDRPFFCWGSFGRFQSVRLLAGRREYSEVGASSKPGAVHSYANTSSVVKSPDCLAYVSLERWCPTGDKDGHSNYWEISIARG